MLFNSYSFILFFILTLVVSRMLGNWSVRKLFLLITSYIFYAAWNPPFIILLWLSTLVDWFIARSIHSCPRKRFRTILLVMSLCTNLGMLGFFKYGNFLLVNFRLLLHQFSLDWEGTPIGIVLPVGISFYTFQTLSYTIDVYRRKIVPGKSFLDYALYVTFFPQLVAGPIVRASEFLPQCKEKRTGSGNQVGWGLTLLGIGLFSKVVLSDHLAAPVANSVYGSDLQVGLLTAWTGTCAFAMQIYYDFFGYSTCAIGVALCLGFDLPDNFRFPYAACGFSDFWQRWHISLSSWLRDYLYIPLGGSRKGKIRTYANLMITMLLGGLWHGASWMFVIWGALHGIFLVIERLCRALPMAQRAVWSRYWSKAILALITFAGVCITWVFFRSGSLKQASVLCKSMLSIRYAKNLLSGVWHGGTNLSSPYFEPMWLGWFTYVLIGILTVGTLVSHFLLRDSSIEQFFSKLSSGVRVSVIVVMLYLTIISLSSEDIAFIYFQF